MNKEYLNVNHIHFHQDDQARISTIRPIENVLWANLVHSPSTSVQSTVPKTVI